MQLSPPSPRRSPWSQPLAPPLQYNPLNEEHGCFPTERKVGDMGNIVVDESGIGSYQERGNELLFLDGSISVVCAQHARA